MVVATNCKFHLAARHPRMAGDPWFRAIIIATPPFLYNSEFLIHHYKALRDKILLL
jgi:hypothetical protein